ncbi:MAG TPA: tetratricopeptide repeat protein, partial [Chromatiaceae bacterium]|nr:tetratricopeptide repeat protein [Chromatiaceae bacterium]
EIISPDEMEDIYLEIADVYEDWEKYDRVIEYLQKVLIINANNGEALGRLWFCVELTETYRESIEFHTQLTNEEPYSYMAWFNLAHAYAGLKNYEEAIEAFEFAIAINDKYDHAYRDCGEVLMKIEQHRKAAEYFIQASLLSEPTKELYFNIGVCFEQLKKYNRARYYFRKATSVDPYFDKAFFKIGENYRREDRWPQAIPSFERAVKLNGKNSAYLNAMGEGYSNIGRLDDAIDTYFKAIKVDPGKKSNWLQLAKVLYLSGEFRKAISMLEEAANKFRNNADIHYLQSAYFYQIGNRMDAIRNLEKGLVKNVAGHGLTFEVTPYMKNDPAIVKILKRYARLQ